MLHGVHGGTRVLTVVGTDGDGVQLVLGDHLLVIGIAFDVRKIVLGEELRGLALNQIGTCDDLNVVKLLICLHMGVGDAARADKADAQLTAGGDYGCLLLGCVFEYVQILIFCHGENLLSLYGVSALAGRG